MTSGICYRSRGEGHPIVFLHGVGGSSDTWDAQLADFGRDYRAIAWDMPGYGASDVVEASFEAWADALARLLDELRIERCCLVGHSIGGMIAQQFLLNHAARVNKIVLSATSPAFGSKDGNFQKQFIASRIGPLDDGKTMAELAAQFVPDLVGPAADPFGLLLALTSMSRVREEAYRAAMETLITFDLRERLSSIHAPTLLIAGENDRAAPPRVMERMAEEIENSTYVCLSGVGHLSNLEKPDQYNATIRQFLTSAP